MNNLSSQFLGWGGCGVDIVYPFQCTSLQFHIHLRLCYNLVKTYIFFIGGGLGGVGLIIYYSPLKSEKSCLLIFHQSHKDTVSIPSEFSSLSCHTLAVNASATSVLKQFCVAYHATVSSIAFAFSSCHILCAPNAVSE